MAKPDEPYVYIVAESYRPDRMGGLHGLVHIRPAPGQIFPQSLQIEGSKSLSRNYPVGTRFRLKVKLTDRLGGGEYLYTSWQWKVEIIPN